MGDLKQFAVYMVHRRAEHTYREWIIMPATDRMPVNVWTRYVEREGARPVWRSSKSVPTSDAELRHARSVKVLTDMRSTIGGHYRQNERNPGGRQWVWDAPIVVEVTAEEVLKFAVRTPYPALNRIKRVLAQREHLREIGAVEMLPTPENMLARFAQLLEPVS